MMEDDNVVAAETVHNAETTKAINGQHQEDEDCATEDDTKQQEQQEQDHDPQQAATDVQTSSNNNNNNNTDIVSASKVSQADDNEIDEETVNVKIVLPDNSSLLEQQMLTTQLVQELMQVLFDRQETCHRTCFGLYSKNTDDVKTGRDGFTRVDNFVEIKTVPVELHVREEPYTHRHARQHLLHVNELCRHQVDDPLLGGSPTVVDEICSAPSGTLSMEVELGDCADQVRLEPLMIDTVHQAPSLRSLSYGSWNPPPSQRRLAGDLMYGRAVTIEGKIFHFTCSPPGFFLNCSTDETFDSTPFTKFSNSGSNTFQNGRSTGVTAQIYHSLVELLSSCSNGFKKQWQALQKHRCSLNPLSRVPSPYPVFNWLGQTVPTPHTPDLIRSAMSCHEGALFSDITISSSPIGQLRDWNEELQLTREAVSSPSQDYISSNRAAFRAHCDFVANASRTAKAVVDGQIPAINPSEEKELQLFIWNNMFVSMAFDVRDHYLRLGGNEAAHAAALNDIRGIARVLRISMLKTDPSDGSSDTTPKKKLCTVGTVISDYQGVRATAQSIVPGILEKEQEQSVVYGSFDFGKSFARHDAYEAAMDELACSLKFRPHSILTKLVKEHAGDASIDINAPQRSDSGLGNSITDSTSAASESELDSESEPIKLTVACPVDIKGIIGNDRRYYILDLIRTTAPDLNYLNGSRQYPHKLVSLRPELIDKQPAESSFLANVMQPDVVLAGDPDYSDLTDVCRSLIDSVIPKDLVDALKEEQPIDGQEFTAMMHAQGVNVRYLGDVIKHLQEHPSLRHLRSIAIAEVLCRSAKHLFAKYLQQTTLESQVFLDVFCAHFLNCFLLAIVGIGSQSCRKTSSRKKVNNSSASSKHPSTVISSMTERSFWSELRADAKLRYRFEMGDDFDLSYSALSDCYGFGRIGILRRFCKMVGMQLRSSDRFAVETERFVPADIVTLYPIIRHTPPLVPVEITRMMADANALIKDGSLPQCYLLVSQAHGIVSTIYGVVHELIVECLKMLASLNFASGDSLEAFVLQQRATLLSERLYGLDDARVAREYLTLAYYCFVATLNSDSQLAVHLMFRTRNIVCLCLPVKPQERAHPLLIRIDANLALMLQAAGAYKQAMKYCESAINQANTTGSDRLYTAVLHRIQARIQSAQGDYKQALAKERQAFNIYRSQLGDKDRKTKECETCMKYYTEQAVALQKQIRETGGRKLQMSFKAPSKYLVADFMNAVNGHATMGDLLSAIDESEELKGEDSPGVQILRELLEQHRLPASVASETTILFTDGDCSSSSNCHNNGTNIAASKPVSIDMPE